MERLFLFSLALCVATSVISAQHCGLEIPPLDTFDYEAVSLLLIFYQVNMLKMPVTVVRFVSVHPVPRHVPRLWSC